MNLWRKKWNQIESGAALVGIVEGWGRGLVRPEGRRGHVEADVVPDLERSNPILLVLNQKARPFYIWFNL